MDTNKIKQEISNCPTSPNCVSSLTDSTDHLLEAIEISGEATEVYRKLDQVVSDMPRTVIVEQSDQHRHYTFTSLIFRFKDDVWFHYDQEINKLHFKSQSRVGHSDLGANKKRIELIREAIGKQ